MTLSGQAVSLFGALPPLATGSLWVHPKCVLGAPRVGAHEACRLDLSGQAGFTHLAFEACRLDLVRSGRFHASRSYAGFLAVLAMKLRPTINSS